MTKANPENCSSKGAYDCAQLQYTIQHRTVMIISPLTSRQISAQMTIGARGQKGRERRGRERKAGNRELKEGGKKRKKALP